MPAPSFRSANFNYDGKQRIRVYRQHSFPSTVPCGQLLTTSVKR